MPFERALAFFLFGALQQFFFDGNKRASRLIMNGLLMSAGIDAVSIPAARADQFNAAIVDFDVRRDGTAMMAFIADCHPERSAIEQMNPRLFSSGRPAGQNGGAAGSDCLSVTNPGLQGPHGS